MFTPVCLDVVLERAANGAVVVEACDASVERKAWLVDEAALDDLLEGVLALLHQVTCEFGDLFHVIL